MYSSYVILDLPSNLLLESQMFLIFVLDIIEHQNLYLEMRTTLPLLMFGLVVALLPNLCLVNQYSLVKVE